MREYNTLSNLMLNFLAIFLHVYSIYYKCMRVISCIFFFCQRKVNKNKNVRKCLKCEKNRTLFTDESCERTVPLLQRCKFSDLMDVIAQDE